MAKANFNSRTRVGCDGKKLYCSKASKISTHAPAWGATPMLLFRSLRQTDFNSRTRVGCDDQYIKLYATNFRFQLTHPRGVRQYHNRPNKAHQDFNSCTRVGCDRKRETRKAQIKIFQLTHPRGVRQQKQTKNSICFCSFFAQLTK